MAKQRMKATAQKQKRMKTEWQSQQGLLMQVQTWLPIAALTIFAVALPYMTGTNDLFLSGIVLTAILV
ncbi:MAG: hypothetical protein QW795_08845, partial [Candidatus Bathyarchaeia archaeon]